MIDNTRFTTQDAFDSLAAQQVALKQSIIANLERLDPADPNTLHYAIKAMKQAHYKPKDLEKLLGSSQTTIGRWAEGQTIPRAIGYRVWVVATVISYLGHELDPLIPNRPKPVATDTKTMGSPR